MLRVEPNCAIETVDVCTGFRVLGDAGALLPEDQQAVPRQRGLLEAGRAGDVVHRDDGQPGVRGERQQFGGAVVVAQPLVAVGHHGAAAVPAPAADDVHGVDGERVGGAHHRADVGVVAEVLDRDVQRMAAAVDVGDDRLPRPVPVGVDDVAGVAVAQQVRVVARVGGRGPCHGPTPGVACHSVGPGWVSHAWSTTRRAYRPPTPSRRAARRSCRPACTATR